MNATTIEAVEYVQQERAGEDGVVITFTYGDDEADVYEVFGHPDLETALNLLMVSPDPEHLLVNLRRLMALTVH